jgi:hypothetical protein
MPAPGWKSGKMETVPDEYSATSHLHSLLAWGVQSARKATLTLTNT